MIVSLSTSHTIDNIYETAVFRTIQIPSRFLLSRWRTDVKAELNNLVIKMFVSEKPRFKS